MNSQNGSKLKNKRRVVVLEYKDNRERIILTKIVKPRKKTPKTHQCNTEIVKEVNETTCKNEKYPIFQAQFKNRTVPTCLRDNCSQQIQRKDLQVMRCRRLLASHERKHHSKIRSESPIIISSDTDSNDTMYDNISLPSYSTDEELEALMKSTRQRMKETDKEWKLTPKQVTSTNNFENHFISSKCASFNSLDTLILEAEDEMLITTTSSTSVNLTLNQEKIIQLKLQETKNKNVKTTCKSVRKDDVESSNRTKQQNHDKSITFSTIIKSENMVKSQPKQFYNKPRSTGEATKHVHNGNIQKIKEEPTKHEMHSFSIKSPETVVKNNIKETSTIVTQEQIYGSRDKKYEKISAVIAKLERDEFDSSLLKFNNIDMKQELYSDI